MANDPFAKEGKVLLAARERESLKGSLSRLKSATEMT